MTAYDKNGFRILFHFAKECPPGRPDVLVVVVSMLNTAPLPIKGIVLQAAVPKVPASRGPWRQKYPSPWTLCGRLLWPAGGSVSTVTKVGLTAGHLPSLQRTFSFFSVNESEVAAPVWDRTLSI